MHISTPDPGVPGTDATYAPGTGRISRLPVTGLALGASVLGLAACGSAVAHVAHVTSPAVSAPAPSASAVAGGRYTTAVAMSGLQVSPPATETASEHLGITWAQAAALFGASSAVQGSHAQAILGYGLATLTGSTMPVGAPLLERRGAWVAITWGGTTSCPAAAVPRKGSSPGRDSFHQIFTAVVIYGQGGNGAIVYRSRGTPPCGGQMTGPTVTPARAVLSVPWQQATSLHDGSVRVSYQAPSCATLFSTGGVGNMGTGTFTLTVEVSVPFDYSGCRTTTDTTTISLFPSPVLSAPPDAPAVPTHVTLAHGAIRPVIVLEAGRIAGGPSGADPGTSSAASLPGDPASTGALPSTGALRGVVQMVGGPAPGSSRPVPATLSIRRFGHRPVEVSTAADGAFSVELPAGTYKVSARRAPYRHGVAACDPTVGRTICVHHGKTTDIVIDCELR